MPNDVYAVGGYSAVAPAALSEPNPPPSRFKGKLGQMYFDTSATPPDLSIYNGSSWVSTAFNEGFPVTPYVVGPSGQAGYQTIQSALDAANADGGGMVWVQPGTYTENLTFYSGIQISSPSEQSVTIIGIHTPPTSGTLNIDRLTFQSATHIFNSNAAGTTAIIMEDCSVNVTNGYTFNLPNWQAPGSIAVFNIGPFGTNDGFINNIGAATVAIFAAGVGNGSANPMIISGTTFFGPGMTINCPVDCASGTNLASTNNQYFGTFTFNGNSIASFYNDSFVTGSSPAITMSSTGAVSLSSVVINSTNNPAITGSGIGTVTLGDVTFLSNAAIASTITKAYAYNSNAPISPYVVGAAGKGNYQTVQSAINAANADGGGIVVIQPGTYTENLTLFDKVHVMGLQFADAGGGVNIIGTHIPPTSGGFAIQYVSLSSATNIFNSAAAGSAHLVLGNALVNVTNGYTFNLPNWTGKLESFDVNAAVGTNDGYVNNTGGSEVDIFECSVGSGTANVMTVSGFTLFAGANIYCPINFVTGSVAQVDYSDFNKTITFSNNSTGKFATCTIRTGASAAITMSSSGVWSITLCTIESSNNPAIAGAGAGTLTYSNLSFTSNANFAGTLTLSGTTLTPDINTSLSSGTLSVKSTTANPGNNAGFIRTIVNGTTAYIPYFTNIAP